MRLRALLAVGLITIAPAFAGDKVFTADTNHTVLGFKASTMLFDVPGRFRRYKAEIQVDPDTLSPVRVRLEINAKSIITSNKMRDDHLRGEDFFNVGSYPKIIFTSNKAWRQGDKIVVQGTLEMHGKARDLQISFQEAKGLNGADMPTWSYKATLPLKRSDFGIGAESVAAKIGLKDDNELDLLMVGFFNDPGPPQPVKAKTHSKAKAKSE